MKKDTSIDLNEIRALLHENAERRFIHPTHHEDMLRYYYLQQGDMRAVDEAMRTLNASMQGTLSKDSLRNMKYLFVVTVALAARFVVESGVPLEKSYAISDLYIQKMDLLGNESDIVQLVGECYRDYVNAVREHKKSNNYSKPIMICLNYIASHFNEKITLEMLSAKTQ